jgi:hypothetical protein
MSATYEPADLALLHDELEVEIETTSAEEGPIHRTIIWVVVDDQDRVLIRSSRGPGARWFREITARPEGRVHVRGRGLAVRAVPATDADRVSTCSEGFLRKYAGSYSARSMASNHLETTLELVPR